MPKLNALRMFDAAARNLSFRQAAEELNLTQGAVAQQVRRLEDDLGHQLFHRHARGLKLTETGQRYHGAIHRALSIIDDANRELSQDSRRVTLSVTPSFASKWLMPRLASFSQRHPDIDLQIVASDQLANFRSDGVDIAIRQGRARSEKGLQSSLLAPLNLCAVCNPSYADEIGPVQHIADFAAHRLLQDSHVFWERLFDEDSIQPQHRMMQFNQTALAMDAAANGQGIALAPRLLIDDEVSKGNLLVLWRNPKPEEAGFHIVHPLTAGTSTATEAVVGWIQSQVT